MADYLIGRLRARLKKGEPITSVTAYDYFTARLAAEAGMDFVLVGDSLGNVIHGAGTTVAVTLDEVIYHTRIVTRHFPAERVVLDIPLGPYLADHVSTVSECIRAFKASGAGAVKLEGAGPQQLLAIEALSSAGVPVMAHIGLQPQRVHVQGGFKRQGKTEEEVERLLREALAVENAGACAVVLELMDPEVARSISENLAIPTIGIGSGPHCDGQILIMHDLLGLLPGDAPGFARQYAKLFGPALSALQQYSTDVRDGSFASTASPGGEEAANGKPEKPSLVSKSGRAEQPARAAVDDRNPGVSMMDEHASALVTDLAGLSGPRGAGDA